jgi:hypothetical protein
MKKLFFLCIVLNFIVTGCIETSESVTPLPVIDWSKYTSVPPETVAEMAANYLKIIDNKPENSIRQVNMDGEMLEALLVGSDGYKLIAAADVKTNNITMMVQFWKEGKFSYYDINSFFNSTQTGMRGQPPLCPPPVTCELPLVKSVRPLIITGTEADEMAKHYYELVKKDPSVAILQVTMDAVLLELLSIGTKGFKFIFAADLKNNKPTVIIQFWKEDDNNYYFNIKDIFTPDMKGMRGQEPLCPPPETCELP